MGRDGVQFWRRKMQKWGIGDPKSLRTNSSILFYTFDAFLQSAVVTTIHITRDQRYLLHYSRLTRIGIWGTQFTYNKMVAGKDCTLAISFALQKRVALQFWPLLRPKKGTSCHNNTTSHKYLFDHTLYQQGGGHCSCSNLVWLSAFIVCLMLLGLKQGGFGPRRFHLVAV